jgi:hypothetical protein
LTTYGIALEKELSQLATPVGDVELAAQIRLLHNFQTEQKERKM